MNRRGIFVAWAGLCLAGVAATAALNAEPYTGRPESPAGKTVACGESEAG
ncbi:hypothetical protein [Streptomyces himastatinicus]|nr:hypothetical protein [Streptomyces himastatinicus]